MKDIEKLAIKEFFEKVSKLTELSIIHSDKYLGDIAEFITACFYNIELAESGREPGHDGVNEDGKVQIKYHGSITRTNIDLGNPDEYETMFVVLEPNSLLRSNRYQEDFLLYRLSSEQVRQHINEKTQTYSCGKSAFNYQPDKVLSLDA